MMAKQFFFIGFLFSTISSFSQSQQLASFSELVEKNKMTFNIPKELTEVAIVENKQMNYDYAIENKKEKIEIRYAIRGLEDRLAEYEKNKQTDADPNKMYHAAFIAIAMNVGDGNKPKQIKIFNAAEVKNEFNADFGATTIVETGKAFAKGKYKYCLIVALHKDNVADAYSFYLSKTQENFANIMPIFYALKFK